MRTSIVLLTLLLASCSFYDRSAPPGGEEWTLEFPSDTDATTAQATLDALQARIKPAGWRWAEFALDGTTASLRVGPLDDFNRPVLKRLITRPYLLELFIVPTGADPATWERSGAPIFTGADVVESYIEDMRKGTRLSLTVTKEAAARLFQATNPSGGGLVVFVDGEREMATHVAAPLRGRIVKLTPAGDDKDAIHLRAIELISTVKAGPVETVPSLGETTLWGEPAK